MDNDITAEDAQWLAEVAAESIGWLPLGDAAYLHVGDADALVIDVVGVPDAWMAGMNLMWVVS
jgi:hypothetical protein